MTDIHAKISAEPKAKLSPELLAKKLQQEFTENELTILLIKLQQ
jgi:hypothetical protein